MKISTNHIFIGIVLFGLLFGMIFPLTLENKAVLSDAEVTKDTFEKVAQEEKIVAPLTAKFAPQDIVYHKTNRHQKFLISGVKEIQQNENTLYIVTSVNANGVFQENLFREYMLEK